jgi:hypothetical protein
VIRLVPALLVTLLALLAPALAEAQQGERTQSLSELKSTRDRVDTQRSRVVAARDARRVRMRSLRGEYDRQARELRDLQAEDPLIPFFHRRKVDKARQALKLTSDAIESVKGELARAEGRERSLRLQLIEAIRAYVNRLLLKASQIAETRREQADHYYSLAFQELAYADDLEGLPLDPGPLELRALAKEQALTTRAIGRLIESYRERADEVATQADQLQPQVQGLQADLSQLEAKAKYALPHLAELIGRTQSRLERMAAFQARLREHAEAYRERVRQLERALGDRNVERGAGAPGEQR